MAERAVQNVRLKPHSTNGYYRGAPAVNEVVPLPHSLIDISTNGGF